jgi:putative ABC transport system substrate-binding protein
VLASSAKRPFILSILQRIVTTTDADPDSGRMRGVPGDPLYRPGMDRRGFLLTSLAGVLSAPLAAAAQGATKIARLGHVFFGTSGSDPAAIEGLRQGLRELGYIENQNIVIEYRYADGNADRLPRLIAELTNHKIDVLVTQGTAATAAAKQGSTMTPVVFVALDPVGSGLVQSLARPGGNITGLSFAHGDSFSGKWLALVKDTAPRARA